MAQTFEHMSDVNRARMKSGDEALRRLRESDGSLHIDLDGELNFWHIYYERFLDDDFWVEYSTKFYELTLARGSFSVKNGIRAIAIGLREVKGNLFVCRGGFLDAPNLERVGGRLVIEDGAEANLGIAELMAERVKTMQGLNAYGPMIGNIINDSPLYPSKKNSLFTTTPEFDGTDIVDAETFIPALDK